MEKRVDAKLCKRIVALGIVMLVIVWLIGCLWSEGSVDAAEEEVSETPVISTGLGNGPQKVTTLEDFGWTSMKKWGAPALNPGSISNNTNTVKFSNFSSSNYYTNNGAGAWWFWNDGWYGSGSETDDSIIISMEHDWKLKAQVYIAATTAYTNNFSGFFIRINDALDGRIVSNIQTTCYQTVISPGHINMYNAWKDLELTYDSATKKVNCKIGGIQLFDQAITNCKKAVIKTAAVRGTLKINTIPTDTTVPQMTFNSFEYTDYYIKADNTITDYAGRRITGAVGNGQFIGVHPKVYNNIPLNTQRYSGTVSLDSQSAVSNITPLDRQDGSNIFSNPLAFTHTGDPFRDVAFDAKIDTGGAAYTPGQKFRLPLVINDDYFSDSDNFTGNTGPAATWDKLQYDAGEGPKDQLPFKMKVVRDTHRELVHDQTQSNTPTSVTADYTHTIAGKAVKPNAHGWYNNNVTINFQTDPDEFNELNFSSATGDTKITAANIAYTAESGKSFTVRGKDENGDPTATEETSEHGNTYSVFGRKGTAEETEDLSAVTTETFRIDKTPPTLKVEDRTELSDPRKLEAADALSGVDYIKWKGPKDTEYTEDHIIAIETDPAATLGTKKPVAQSLPKLTDLGNYTFAAVDLAGNESDPLTITNNRPVLSAKDAKVSFKDTVANNFNLLTTHKSGAEDKEDGKLSTDRLDWEVRKAGTTAVLDKGTGTEALSDYLSVGSYEVTFFLNDTGTDADGNKPDPEKVTVKLTITPEGPPDITLVEKPNAGTVDGITSTRPDGSRHYMVEDEKTIIVDTSDPYSGGSLTDQEVQKEIEDHFNFKSQLPYPANNLEVDLKIYDDKGNDITGTPVNTLKNGSYTAVYVATDKSGCTTTLQLTYNIKENVIVTFHPGKGDYKDGSENRQAEIKVNKAPAKKDLPDGTDTNVLLPPADTCFIGWGTSQSAKTTVDPTAIKLNKDTTYYAIFGPDINNNNIPDSREAIFIFKSGDPEHAAFKYTDKTMVGILVPGGTAVTLPTEKIPELLFERIEDKSYRLKGWKTDATDDKILTTEELTALGRHAGTKLTVTAIIEEYEIKKEDKILVTFFSSEPKSSPLEGGEGQTVELDAPKPDEPVTIPKTILPKVSLSTGSKLEGWKTSDTGDIILTDDQVASQQLYGGREITCVAYVKPEVKEPEKVPSGKDKVTEKEVTKKIIIEKEKTKKIPAANQKKEKPSNNVTFIFYTSRAESATIQTGDGTEVTLPAGSGGKTSLVEKLIPELKIQDGSSFIGWRTSFTGSRLLTDKELCELDIPAGTTVRCTAYFKYKERQLKTEGSTKTVTKDGEALTIFGDEQVPLGSRPDGFGDTKRNNPSCIVHWLMLIWLVLSGLTIFFRLHNRKRSDEFLYPDENHPMTQYRTEEDYRGLIDSQHTDIRDYLFLACDMIIGITLFTIGTCMFELPLLTAGAALACYDLIRLKMLDRREKKAMEEALEKIGNK